MEIRVLDLLRNNPSVINSEFPELTNLRYDVIHMLRKYGVGGAYYSIVQILKGKVDLSILTDLEKAEAYTASGNPFIINDIELTPKLVDFLMTSKPELGSSTGDLTEIALERKDYDMFWYILQKARYEDIIHTIANYLNDRVMELLYLKYQGNIQRVYSALLESDPKNTQFVVRNLMVTQNLNIFQAFEYFMSHLRHGMRDVDVLDVISEFVSMGLTVDYLRDYDSYLVNKWFDSITSDV